MHGFLQVHIPYHICYLPLSARELNEVSAVIWRILDLPQKNLQLELTDDKRSADLNQQFLDRAGPTNVLSFTPDAEDEKACLGYINVSLDALWRESFLYEQDSDEYLLRLIIHALLHLIGYEHGQAMHEMTERALREWNRARESNP